MKRRRSRLDESSSLLPLYDSSKRRRPTRMSSSSPATKRSSTRKVLQGVGRPLRRVSRGLFSSNKRSRSVASPPRSYGSILEQDGNSPMMTDGNCSGVFSEADMGGSVLTVTQRPSAREHDQDMVVRALEYVLLRLLLLMGAFCLGASYHEWKSLVLAGMGYVSVAWATCLVIILAPRIKEIFSEQPVMDERQEEVVPLLAEDSVLNEPRQIVPLQDAVETSKHKKEASQQHAELENLYVMNTATGDRVVPNRPSQPCRIENDLFEGQMVLMFRTSDAEDPSNPTGTPENTVCANYFSSKQRRFEFQYQLKLKKVPEGNVFFSCEVEEPVNMGMIQRAFVGASMSFVKKMNNGFNYNLNADGKGEKPYIAFTIEASMDRLVVTKPGQAPPKLGQEVAEAPESIKQRKKGNFKVDWNTEDTYTFCVWSAYCDFLEYKVMLPGVRPFFLSSVTGDQHINFKLYTIPSSKKSDKHSRSDMQTYVDVEFSNTNCTVMGPCAAAWVKNQKKLANHEASLEGIPEEPLTLQKSFSQDDEEEDEEEDFVEEDYQDWETAAELGEGMYLRSGDSVVLKEFTGDDGGSGYLTMAGGFAVIQQNQASSIIVIEKARRSRARSKLIKSGDSVMFKLVTKGRNENHTETKYLTVHRGWWLKWVALAPTKNGYFTIYTHENEYDPQGGAPQLSTETQTSYLTLNGTFWLRHRRWSKYQVGISAEESPTYGGRVLGLLRQGSSSVDEQNMPNPEDDDDLDAQEDHVDGKAKSSWLKPLYLVSQEATSANLNASLIPKPTMSPRLSSATVEAPTKTTFIESIDVPAWVEMMHRTDRRPKLGYVVRVVEERKMESDEDEGESAVRCHLRTGRNIADVIRLVQSKDVTKITKRELDDPKESRTNNYNRSRSGSSGDFDGVIASDVTTGKDKDSNKLEMGSSENDYEEVMANQSESSIPGDFEVPLLPDQSAEYSLEGRHSPDRSVVNRDGTSDVEDPDDPLDLEGESVGSGELLTADEFDVDEGLDSTEYQALAAAGFEDATDHSKKKRKIMGKIAKSMKVGTSATGKQVVKQSKKVGKGTFTAGRVMISPINRGAVRHKKPPRGEPKSKSTKTNRRRKARESHVAVRKAVKSAGRKGNREWLVQTPSVLAGQLCAPDQSCRTASHVLSRITSLTLSSDSTDKSSKILTKQLTVKSDLDRWFLQGGAIELGVVPPKDMNDLVHESLVARCLWESHWREEWCGIYSTRIMFFAPLAKKAARDLSFIDVESVRRIDPVDGRSPLPGFPMLAIETAWRCYYVAFSGEETRDIFWKKLTEAIFMHSHGEGQGRSKGAPQEKDLWKARFWQGFQSSVESSMSGGMGKWAKINSSSKMVNRVILNSRRMVFDIEPLASTGNTEGCDMETIGAFSQELLAKSLTFSFESMEEDPDSFVRFLDFASKLRSMPLDIIDHSSRAGFCIFANIYHCLLQHALLLSVNGPCTKRSVGHFMRTSCYEIGGDVFSLAELHCCVLRGKMSRAVSPKPPYVEAPRKSNSYRFYALDFSDPRINFLLKTPDCSCPKEVPVLTPESLEEDMKASAFTYVQSQMSIDAQKKQILLPKICDVYRHDFGNGEAKHSLLYCLKYLTEGEREVAMKMLGDDHVLMIKFQPSCDKFHMFLTRRQSSEKGDTSVSISDIEKSTHKSETEKA